MNYTLHPAAAPPYTPTRGDAAKGAGKGRRKGKGGKALNLDAAINAIAATTRTTNTATTAPPDLRAPHSGVDINAELNSIASEMFPPPPIPFLPQYPTYKRKDSAPAPHPAPKRRREAELDIDSSIAAIIAE
eukprot:Hpha_TRINITY_DN27305_c0_g1::TRINITY_DN27305_c0_g1_i1::g.572::m.572